MTYRVKATRCIRCNELLDAATSVTGDDQPKRGDASICLKCNHVAIFTRGGKLREPRSDELRTLMADPRITLTRQAVSLLHADKGRPN
jgi:hypothetical protein